MLTIDSVNRRSQQRVDGIDLLRGLAIFFVLMNHVNIRLLLAKVPYTRGIPQQIVHLFVWNGQFGVQMFFAISGFLITSIALRRWGSLSRVSVRNFYWLRVARIVPLLLLLLAVLSVLHFARLHDYVVPANRGGLGRALLAALTLRLNVLEAHRGYLPGSWDVLWSLSIEEMFYLFFPLVCIALGRGKMLTGLLLTLVALGPFARTIFTAGNPIWQEKSYLGGMDAIALGCLAALFASRNRLSIRTLRVFNATGIAGLILILGFASKHFMLGIGRAGLAETILAICTCMIIICAAQSNWKCPRVLTPLLKLGQFSYEVYLTHMFVVFGLFDLFVSHGKSLQAVPVLFVATIVMAGLLGAAVAHFYSEPMNRFLRRRFLSGAEQFGLESEGSPIAPRETSLAV